MFIHLPTDTVFPVFGYYKYGRDVLKLMYEFLCGYTFSFLLGGYLGVERLGHMMSMYLIFKETAKLFSKVVVPFFMPTKRV